MAKHRKKAVRGSATPPVPAFPFAHGKDCWAYIGDSHGVVPLDAKNFTISYDAQTMAFSATSLTYVGRRLLLRRALDRQPFDMIVGIGALGDAEAVAFVAKDCQVMAWKVVAAGRLDATMLHVRISGHAQPSLMALPPMGNPRSPSWDADWRHYFERFVCRGANDIPDDVA